MFALLALAGDIGCLVGPSVAGWIADLFGGNLRVAFAFAALFPLVNAAFLFVQLKKRRNEAKSI
jgi:MFS family permease